MKKEQREFLIKQKIEKLNAELGISVDKNKEVSEFEEKIQTLPINETSKNKLLDELKDIHTQMMPIQILL